LFPEDRLPATLADGYSDAPAGHKNKFILN